MQTAISRVLSPSPTHSGSADEFKYSPEISGDESDEEMTKRQLQEDIDSDEGRPSSPKTGLC